MQAALGDLHFKSFAGPLQRMRFTGLAQAVVEKYGAQLALEVDLSHSTGSLTYTRSLSNSRSIGWQFQEGQLRLFVLVRDRGLSFGPGVWRKFAPDFVYRYRKVHPSTSTHLLAEALAELTARVNAW